MKDPWLNCRKQPGRYSHGEKFQLRAAPRWVNSWAPWRHPLPKFLLSFSSALLNRLVGVQANSFHGSKMVDVSAVCKYLQPAEAEGAHLFLVVSFYKQKNLCQALSSSSRHSFTSHWAKLHHMLLPKPVPGRIMGWPWPTSWNIWLWLGRWVIQIKPSFS